MDAVSDRDYVVEIVAAAALAMVHLSRLCEEIVLSSGLAEEAYQRYGLRANRAGTYLATFRAVARKYPHKASREILHDLVQTTPG